jgi:hypothetical protein
MNRFETLGAALLTSAFCVSFTACNSSESPASKLDDAPAAAPLPAEVEDQKPDPLDAELVLESEPAPAASLAPSEETVLASAAMIPAPVEREPQPAGSLRSASLLPHGTPEANVIAFTNLRLGKRDKAPIAGAGETGIHLDELELGSGWASSRCEQSTRQFVVDQDERINLCFRVVHPREAESVTVEWARDGKLRQSIEVGVASTHAYLTRAWMPVTAGRAGQWTATVKSADGAVLGQLDFTVAK